MFGAAVKCIALQSLSSAEVEKKVNVARLEVLMQYNNCAKFIIISSRWVEHDREVSQVHTRAQWNLLIRLHIEPRVGWVLRTRSTGSDFMH